MVIFKTIKELREYISIRKKEGYIINFIPTMGALHQGHISLLNLAQGDKALTIVSIFVNPTQFNDKADYDKYPKSDDNDIVLLNEANCDVLFLPDFDEIYPSGSDDARVYDFLNLESILEGHYRPGHFKGVGQVVGRFIDIIEPDNLYVGQKDYQQCLIIRELIDIKHNKAKLVVCPTIREQDGLAMSSRNRRLNDSQRAVASTIYQCLVSFQAKQNIDKFDIVKKECHDILVEKGFTPEYIELADAKNLNRLTDFDKDKEMIVLIAAYIGDIRLIDNMLLSN